MCCEEPVQEERMSNRPWDAPLGAREEEDDEDVLDEEDEIEDDEDFDDEDDWDEDDDEEDEDE
jgi:hypothetical protein